MLPYTRHNKGNEPLPLRPYRRPSFAIFLAAASGCKEEKKKQAKERERKIIASHRFENESPAVATVAPHCQLL